MLKLKNLILSLDKEDYQALLGQLQSNKADKFSSLLSYYREQNVLDEEIISELNVNINSFYTLKSRLFDKIQQTLTIKLDDSKADLYQKANTIPELIFNTNKDISIAILLKLEKDLIENDLPFELPLVYSALKKLHLYHPKYYEYSQLYNKHLSYLLAADKADELFGSFTKTLGDYLLSNNPETVDLLLLLKGEINNIEKQNKSHHLIVYRNIVNISLALFVPGQQSNKDDAPIEDYLKECEDIFDIYPKNNLYGYFSRIIVFLYFEYYFQLKQYKKAQQYYLMLRPDIETFLLYNHTTLPTKFLLSIVTYLGATKQFDLMEEDVTLIKDKFLPEKHDYFSFINFQLYTAACLLYQNKLSEAASNLNNIINNISLKHYPHAEIETKLFLSLIYTIEDKISQAESVIRSVTRKIKDLNEDGFYENGMIFVKLLKTSHSNSKTADFNKLSRLLTKFHNFNNNNHFSLLKFLNLDDSIIDKLMNAGNK
jgi:hypothetical protein